MEIQNNQIKIVVPSGMEIDKENSTFECIKFKPIKRGLPKTWEEFCKIHPRMKGEAWLTQASKIDTINISVGDFRAPKEDRNLLPNQQYAKAMLALCQLIQLKDYYNDGWMPDWSDDQFKYTIYNKGNHVQRTLAVNLQRILSFKSAELCDEFFKNFRDLIEIAKPLL